jgi:hypothetical protein
MTTDAASGASGTAGEPGASALLPAAPATEAQLTREAAYAKRGELLKDPQFRERYLKGGAEEQRQMREVISGMTRFDLENVNDAAVARQAAERELAIDGLRRTADISDEVAQQIRDQSPVSRDEFKKAEQEKKRLMSDKEFVTKWLAGDRAARTRMALVSVILGSRIADEAAK